jgi:tetratricopeptide (TPR) repeat protein
MGWFRVGILSALSLMACQNEPPKRTSDVAAHAPSSGVPSPRAAATSAPPSAPSTRSYVKPLDADVCADCHPDEVEGYQKTGMARSLYRPGGRPAIEDFSKATVSNPPFSYRAYVDEQGRWWQEETMPEVPGYRRTIEVLYVIGSGNHTRSYLGRVEGDLIEMPLTWYVRRGIWDMSPGYEGSGNYRFSRPIKGECLFCHNGLAQQQPYTAAGYVEPLPEGIGCERCHGDGRAHVAARNAGKGPPTGQADPTILNPKRLSAKAQLRVCQQCHLQGEARILLTGQRWDTYDPRTPLADYMSIYESVHTGGHAFSIASHGQRLALSACFKKSGDALTCTTCHDPHRPQNKQANRAACVGCHAASAKSHQAPQCTQPEHGKQDCSDCHLRKAGTSDIPHVTFTDHWIRTRPEAPVGKKPVSLKLEDRLAGDRADASKTEALARLGVAHAQQWRLHGKDAHLIQAAQILDQAGRAGSTNPEMWTEMGQVQSAMGNPKAALAALTHARRYAPDGMLFRVDVAQILEGLGRLDEAESVLRDAITRQPKSRVAWGNLANILQKKQQFAAAEEAYERADELAPHLALTAINRGFGRLAQNDPAGARKWFAEAIRRDPAIARGYFAMGTVEMSASNWQAAETWFDRALKAHPEDPDSLWMKARLAQQRNDLPAARALYERLMKAAPQRVVAYLDLAALEAGQKRWSARQKVLTRGLSALPNHPALLQALQARME